VRRRGGLVVILRCWLAVVVSASATAKFLFLAGGCAAGPGAAKERPPPHICFWTPAAAAPKLPLLAFNSATSLRLAIAIVGDRVEAKR